MPGLIFGATSQKHWSMSLSEKGTTGSAVQPISSPNSKTHYYSEAQILEELRQHGVPGLVPFKTLYYYSDQQKSHQSSMILNCCNKGDLLDYLLGKPHCRLDEDEARKIIKSLVHILKCCHALGLMHRDIKLENILVSPTTSKKPNQRFNIVSKIKMLSLSGISTLYKEEEPAMHIDRLIKMEAAKYHEELQESQYNYEVFLSGFGFATKFEGSRKLGLHLRVGALEYMAPEVIKSKYDERADIWSLGVLLHGLLTGQFPFEGETDPRTILQIVSKDLHSEFRSNHKRYSHLSQSVKDLMLQMLNKDPRSRITLDEIQKHPWIVDRPAPTAISTHVITHKEHCFILPQGVELGLQENIVA